MLVEKANSMAERSSFANVSIQISVGLLRPCHSDSFYDSMLGAVLPTRTA